MRNLLVATAILCTTTGAIAAPWVVDTTRSTLKFEGTQTGEPFHGAFKSFTPEIDFSEKEPEKGKIRVVVDITSLTADTKDQSEALPTKDWLDAKTFPKAEFVSTTIIRTGEHAYAATGNLALRGVSRNITLPFTLTPEAGAMHAKGSVTLNRHDFSVGIGQWEKDTYIAYPVKVNYDIIASQK